MKICSESYGLYVRSHDVPCLRTSYIDHIAYDVISALKTFNRPGDPYCRHWGIPGLEKID